MTTLARSVPGVGALRGYKRRWLASDAVAGIVLAAMLVPQGMAYAELAGLPAVTGLYTTVTCLVAYALFGPSRILVLGPDSSLSPMIAAAIAPLVVTSQDPGEAIALAGVMAVMVGLILIGLGVAKLGFVADLLADEVKVGYMNGLAILIIVGQLPKLSGFSTDADGFVDEARAFVEGFDARNPTALTLGLVALVLLVAIRRLTSRFPAVLVVVVGATLATSVFDLDIATVGTLPEGLPRPSVPWVDFGDLPPLLVASLGITLVSMTDTIATSAAFAARSGDEVDPNRELVANGAANIAAGLFRGFAISASSSRTAVAVQSGAKTQLTGLVGALLVALLLIFFNGLLADLPETTLAAVVIGAALSLADIGALRRYLLVRPSSFLLSLAGTLGVIFLGVLNGILVAVVLSVLFFFRRSWWPHGEVLGQVDGREGWHSVRLDPGAMETDGVVVYRWEAPLFFANAGMFRQEVRHQVKIRRPRWVVLQCEAITDIDVTAAEMLERLDIELNDQGIHLAFVELRSRLHHLVHQYGLFATIDRNHFYESMDEALADIAASDEAGPGAESDSSAG